MQGIRKKPIKNVEKTTLQNDKIPSKSNYETIPPKTHSQITGSIRKMKYTKCTRKTLKNLKYNKV
jgi:hypothetical protein